MILPSRHFSPFKLFLHRETGTALMLNPKVATTFTRDFLAKGFVAHLGHADPSDFRYRLLKVPRRFPTPPLRDYVDFFRHPEGYALYGFVRNPYGRLLSAWRNKFLDAHLKTPDHRDSAYPRSMRWRELRPIRRFAAARGLAGGAPGTLVGFDTFLRYAAAQPEGRRDHHWDAQESVLMMDRLRYARIFRLEDEGDAGFLTIGARLGFPEGWMRDMLARPPTNRSKAAAGYTPETAALARGLVAGDLARFGYDADSWQEF
jgi:hypothetical protein